jgi:hypothetical protein
VFVCVVVDERSKKVEKVVKTEAGEMCGEPKYDSSTTASSDLAKNFPPT